MNCDQAKQLSIIDFLCSRGIEPKNTTFSHFFYLSPLREERTASFKVDIKKNLWYDFGAGKGGTIIDLVREIYSTDIEGALTILSQSVSVGSGRFSSHPQKLPEQTREEPQRIRMEKVQPLSNKTLIAYLESRGIPYRVGKKYLHEAYFYYRDNVKPWFALAFKTNTEGSWELNTRFDQNRPTWKNSYGHKDFTFIQGNNRQVLIFESFMDFLSALVFYKVERTAYSVLILNSTALTDKAIVFLKSLSELVNVVCYLDNDNSGILATRKIQREFAVVVDRSVIYRPYKDFNEYLVKVNRLDPFLNTNNLNP